MNDFELLLVLLAVFYLWECVYWIRRPGIVFRTWLGFAWKSHLPNGGLSNRFGAFLLSSALPSSGGFFPVHWASFLFTEISVVKHPDPLDLYDEAPTTSGESISFAQIKSVSSKRHYILINGKKFAKAGTASLAQRFVKQIKQLRETAPEKRIKSIEHSIRETLNSKSIAASVEALNKSTRFLSAMCFLLFVHVGFVIPWVGSTFTLGSVWMWLVGVLVLANSAIAFQFCRLHRTFFPADSDERFQHTFMMTFYPLASIRAVETLARPLLEQFHPIAVAKVLLKESAFDDFASNHLRRLGVRVQGTTDPTQRAYFEMLESATKVYLEEEKIDSKELMKSPRPTDSTCRSFCPRCGSQFTFAEGICSDCGSVAVVKLDNETV